MARLTKASAPLDIGAPGGWAGCGEARGLAVRSLPPPVTPTLLGFDRSAATDD